MVALNAAEKAAMLAFLKSRRGDKVSRALPGRVRTCGADALDVVALDAAYVIRCLRL